MIEHRRDYSIFCRPEVAGGIVLGCEIKPVIWWLILKLLAAGLSEIIAKKYHGTTMLRICELLASAVFRKFEFSHLRNALNTVRPFGPHFRGQEAKMSNDLRAANEVLEPLF